MDALSTPRFSSIEMQRVLNETGSLKTEIISLKAENERLRRALEKIATGKYHSDDNTCMTMMACCNRAEETAREALSGGKG